MSNRIHYTVAGVSQAIPSAGYAIVRDDETEIEAVRRSIERKLSRARNFGIKLLPGRYDDYHGCHNIAPAVDASGSWSSGYPVVYNDVHIWIDRDSS